MGAVQTHSSGLLPSPSPQNAQPRWGRGKRPLPLPAGVQQDDVQGCLLLLHLLEDPLHADTVLRGIGLWSINRDHVVPPQMFIPMPSIVEYSWEQGEERMNQDANLQICKPAPHSHVPPPVLERHRCRANLDQQHLWNWSYIDLTISTFSQFIPFISVGSSPKRLSCACGFLHRLSPESPGFTYFQTLCATTPRLSTCQAEFHHCTMFWLVLSSLKEQGNRKGFYEDGNYINSHLDEKLLSFLVLERLTTD